jgi:hypothetical protein
MSVAAYWWRATGSPRVFGVRVGGHVTYQFYKFNLRTGVASLGQRSTFLVTAIVDTPPVLTDRFDEAALAVLPPAATARYRQAAEFSFGWVGLRLRTGEAGIPAAERQLAALGNRLGVQFQIRRLDTIHREVRQAIAPQAIALAIFGALAALAMLILVGQALAQMLSRSAAEMPVVLAGGRDPPQAAMAVGLDGVVVVLTAVVLAVAGAVAVSPLAPVGPVRQFDPARPAGHRGGRDPAGSRTGLRTPAGHPPGRALRVHRGGHGGGHGARLRREPHRAGHPSGQVRMELDAADGFRGRLRQLAARHHGQADRPSARAG